MIDANAVTAAVEVLKLAGDDKAVAERVAHLEQAAKNYHAAKVTSDAALGAAEARHKAADDREAGLRARETALVEQAAGHSDAERRISDRIAELDERERVLIAQKAELADKLAKIKAINI